jgi:hypothetical protein
MCMKTRSTIPAGILVILAAAARGDDTAAPAAQAAPRLVFEAKEFNFGKQVVGATVEHIFAFKNGGDAELQIRRVKPSCGCTAALLSRERLAPGEAGEVKVTFQSHDRQGPQDLVIQVFSNDARERDNGENTTTLHLRGEIANLVQVLPGSVYFQPYLRGTKQERKITILPLDVAAIACLGVESSDPLVSVAAAPLERSGHKGFELTVAIATEAPIGKIDARLTVRTDHPKQPIVHVPVFGTVHGQLSVFPDRLLLFAQDIAAHEPVITVQRLAGDDRGPLPIEAVEAPPYLAAEIAELVPGKRSEVRLKLQPDAPRGPFAGVVRIFTRDAEQPVFEVSVVGEIPRVVKVAPAALWVDAAAGLGNAQGIGESVASVSVTGGLVTEARAEGLPFEIHVAGGPPGPDGKWTGINIVALLRTAASKPGPFAGKIVIKTDVKGDEVIEVPVRGILR